MNDERCENCRFYWNGIQEEIDDGDYMQQCRRHAPTKFEIDEEGWRCAEWPQVGTDEWCGDWEKQR